MKYPAMMRGPVCYRREVWRSPEKVVREWSSWIVRGGINTSSSFATGNPWVLKCRPKGPWTRWLYPHGGELLLIKEWTEIRPSSSKDFEEEVVWRAFTKFDMPRKVIRGDWIRHPHWVKLYDETNGQNNLHAKHTKSFFCYKYVRNSMLFFLKKHSKIQIYTWCTQEVQK